MPTIDLTPFSPPSAPVDELLPVWTRDLADLQTAIPELAKDPKRLAELDCLLGEIPTLHRSICGDARDLAGIVPNSIHLVLTSPPYWTLKEYRDSEGQMGHLQDYEQFLVELDKVWQRCFDVLVPGGRLICVVGDVCLSRRKNNGRHTVRANAYFTPEFPVLWRGKMGSSLPFGGASRRSPCRQPASRG